MASYAEVDKLMNDVRKVLSGQKKDAIVALCEKVLKLLSIIGLVVYNVQIRPHHVGVHPDNRYGLGVKAELMVKLAIQIFRSGFRWSACGDAICAEEDGGYIADFTANLQKRSSKLGKQSKSAVHYGSLACSHLNQWLVAALCSAECDEAAMSVDGRMSR